jgi:PGF-pre-PGF domain-containing protein
VENIASSNTLGLCLFDSNYNTLTANTANSNSESGFDLTISQHNSLSGNTASENTRGITLQGWTGEISTADNILSSNTVSNNSELGIWLTAAANNTLDGNSFDNIKNVKDTGHNIWNTTSGNYWSDYTGSDADGNGIGDTPYVINSVTGSKDYLPICRQTEIPEENGQDESDQTENGQHSGSRSAIFGSVSRVPSVNVLAAGVSRQPVLAGQQAEFTFTEPGCSVTGISFVSGTSAGTVTGKVETLSGLPKTVQENPEGMVFQYMNIVIGSQVFGESGTFEGAVIDFKVPRTWMGENNIDEASIFLNRFHDNAWTPLPTEKTAEDDEFLYFRAETPGFSYYSIIGEMKGAVTITPAATGSEADAQQITGNEVPEASPEEAKKSPGFGLVFAVAGILSVLFLLKNK